MPYDEDQIDNLDAELDALSTPTTEEVLLHSRDYDAGIVAASAARRAINGGGLGATALDDLTDVDLTGATDGDVLTKDGSDWIAQAPAGGSQPILLPVTLTDVDVDGPVAGVEFTIPADYLPDGCNLSLDIQADWTFAPYTTLELVVAGSAPQMVADHVYPGEDTSAHFAMVATRNGDTLSFISRAPEVPPGSWDGWVGDAEYAPPVTALTFAGIDFSADVEVQLLVSLESAGVGAFWHPTAAAATIGVSSQAARLLLQTITSLYTYLSDGSMVYSPYGGELSKGNVQFVPVGEESAYMAIERGWLLITPTAETELEPPVNWQFGTSKTPGGSDVAWGATNAGLEFFDGSVQEAPDDSDIPNSWDVQWFDDTSGKPLKRYKRRDSAGNLTVGIVLGSTGSQTTVGAAGGGDALPATPSKYIKVRDVNGDEYVIPAYAAS